MSAGECCRRFAASVSITRHFLGLKTKAKRFRRFATMQMRNFNTYTSGYQTGRLRVAEPVGFEFPNQYRGAIRLGTVRAIWGGLFVSQRLEST